jgi:hypothetical protein
MREEMNHSGCGHSHSGYGHSNSVKEQVLARSDYLCECCGEWAYTAYNPEEGAHRLAAEDMASAVAVCRRCLAYIEEDPVTGRVRTEAAERKAALAGIHGQGSDSPVFRLLDTLEDCKQKLAPALPW